MNNAVSIRSYDDLLLEEQRLTALAGEYKDLLAADLRYMKERLAPVARVVTIAGKITAPVKKNPLLSTGIGVGASLLAETAMSRIRPIRWLVRLAAPFLAGKATRLIQGQDKKNKKTGR